MSQEPAQPVQEPVQAQPKQEPAQQSQVDQTAFFQNAYNQGAAKVKKDFENLLSDNFGTADINEIKNLLGKKGDSKGDEKYTQVINENTNLKTEIEKIKRENENVLKRSKVSEVANNFSFQNATFAVNTFLDQFDLKKNHDGSEYVTQKGSETPFMIKNGKSAGIKDIFESWRDDKNYNMQFLFNKISGVSHLDTSGGLGSQTRARKPHIVSKDELRNPKLTTALKRSGQLQDALMGKEIDYSLVEPYLKLN